jgi:arginine N-succinyltransferase
LSVVNKKFIAELMPDHPIYIPLLPADAQGVIGKPHADSARAVKNLEAEGFRFANMVDIFDAGPVVSCPRDEIRTVRASRRARVTAIVDDGVDGPECMLGTTTEAFRACRAVVRWGNGAGGVGIARETGAALQLSVGDPVRIVELSPPAALHAPKAV